MALTKEKAIERIQAHVEHLGPSVGVTLTSLKVRPENEEYLLGELAEYLGYSLSCIERELVHGVHFEKADIAASAAMVASLREAHGSLFAYFKN